MPWNGCVNQLSPSCSLTQVILYKPQQVIGTDPSNLCRGKSSFGQQISYSSNVAHIPHTFRHCFNAIQVTTQTQHIATHQIRDITNMVYHHVKILLFLFLGHKGPTQIHANEATSAADLFYLLIF